jgi:hypothetical protein
MLAVALAAAVAVGVWAVFLRSPDGSAPERPLAGAREHTGKPEPKPDDHRSPSGDDDQPTRGSSDEDDQPARSPNDDGRGGSPDDAPHPLLVGALEDAVKWPQRKIADQRIGRASQAGFNMLDITTQWIPGQTRPHPGELRILRGVAAATKRRRIRLLLTVYAPRPRFAPLQDAQQQQFALFMATLARDLPDVHDFAVWNEPNLNGFWLYQFDEAGRDLAARAYTSLLARSYDALKDVSPKIRVYGGSLAPRGADNPTGKRHTQSPTAFIRNMGDAYRGSGRREPIMDVFAIHPYLERSEQPPSTTHPRGTAVGIADYDKLVRLLGRAFDGTAQPGSKLPIAYTEFGVQARIPERAQAFYTNLDSLLGKDAVDEATQARYYRQALELAACQPTVIALLFFHLFDEADLDRWQSGPYYADTKAKSSLPAIREAAEKAREGKLATCS